MLGARMLFQLFVLAAGFLALVVVVTTGGLPGFAHAALLKFSQFTVGDTAGASGGGAIGAPGLLLGFIAGWCVRWLYSLPWGSIPRAIGAWLLGWRQSVVMLIVGLACVAILLH
ncbi:MAG: hypothetical protein ACK5JT_08780 [Hyphomicrobiaceae bacterium]